jgi:hypothetical protein
MPAQTGVHFGSKQHGLPPSRQCRHYGSYRPRLEIEKVFVMSDIQRLTERLRAQRTARQAELGEIEQSVRFIILATYEMSHESLRGFPTLKQLQMAYRATARELSGSNSDYERCRAQDLESIAGKLVQYSGFADLVARTETGREPVESGLHIYRAAATALLRYRQNLADDKGRPLIWLSRYGLSFMSHTSDYVCLEPRLVKGGGGSALGEQDPSQEFDNKIASKIFSRLPEECRRPLKLPYGIEFGAPPL